MFIVLNPKAYLPTKKDVAALLPAVRAILAKRHEVALALPSALLSARRGRVLLAAQDVSPVLPGPQTGELTAEALRGAGVSHVIVGHSERRARGETDALVKEKLVRALQGGLTPILCIGEEARDPQGRYLAVIAEQLSIVLSGVAEKDRLRVVIAYEPVWAISTHEHRDVSADDVAEATLFVRSVLRERFSEALASKARILYGGSVSGENIAEYARTGRVDGFLVGRASASPAALRDIARALPRA